MKELKELVRIDYSLESLILNNLTEACKRLNAEENFYHIRGEVELSEVLRDKEAYKLKLLNQDPEVKEILFNDFKCHSFEQLTPEECTSGMFNRTLKKYVDYYSYQLDEITRGRTELGLNISTNEEMHKLWTNSIILLEYKNDKWTFDPARVKERCSFYVIDINQVEAIKRLKDWDRYRNHPDTPEWFKRMFPQLAKGDSRHQQVIEDNGNVSNAIEYYGFEW